MCDLVKQYQGFYVEVSLENKKKKEKFDFMPNQKNSLTFFKICLFAFSPGVWQVDGYHSNIWSYSQELLSLS